VATAGSSHFPWMSGTQPDFCGVVGRVAELDGGGVCACVGVFSDTLTTVACVVVVVGDAELDIGFGNTKPSAPGQGVTEFRRLVRPHKLSGKTPICGA